MKAGKAAGRAGAARAVAARTAAKRTAAKKSAPSRPAAVKKAPPRAGDRRNAPGPRPAKAGIARPAKAGIVPPAKAGITRTASPSTVPPDEARFFERAWAMEVEAVERYSMLADAMEEHNNPEVTELFRKLARIEQLHADRILEEHPALDTRRAIAADAEWEDGEGPESADPGELHYRMQPYHALQMVLECEKRANRFFEKMARAASTPSVRDAALEMAAEEDEHVRLIEDWIKRTPRPEDDWEYDPDPPASPD